ncbi:RagB/SusD family nutrient uptake outer membrane protein [Mesonia sp.]|uniref:RagB/SusD family nutrient uptake outer membrane protein n=1 Tax=Mesonia sp. TaxID=1960830 RepID=UPI00175D583B|nr:RagB/SusD family nutrient uptake outer membrane protein [Mesonia sp.]HIB37025.1 RagB/SusD family nutrient uptake outer membrane protein [Mesonia sp.]HIO27400.1 RagB/SusD family nutrient uptake outer membrane protein [Flavobacteriaceae bacterium]
MRKFNIKFLTIIALGFGLLTSCQDELDQLPQDAFAPETYYQTPGDFENATRGMYSGFLGGSYYGGFYLSRPDIMTDNVILAQVGRRSNQFFYEWRYVPNASWDIMTSPYIITNRANRIINNIDNLIDGDEKNNYLGEAKAARALALFDMVKVYSKIPAEGSEADGFLGMPIVTNTDPNYQALRPTIEESMSFVISELEEAASLVASDNNVDRIGRDAVYGLLSRAYLYNGDYQNVIDAANQVSTQVAERANFSGIWTDSNNDGVIFKIDQDRNLDGVAIGVEYSQSSPSGVIPEYVASFEFFNKFENGDIRKSAYLAVEPDANGNVYNTIIKYRGEAGQNNGIVDAKILRAAEVYLNKAEAYAMLGNDALALAALNEVRSRRYVNFVSDDETGQDLMDAIMLERRLELAYEGHRFFDLKRWNLPVTRSATDGDFFDGSGTPTTFTTLPENSPKWQLPIPQNEINIYPEFQQNPGY